MEIKYNIPFEVTETQYNKLMYDFSGVVAGRKKDGKFYIKVWLMEYAKHIQQLLQHVK